MNRRELIARKVNLPIYLSQLSELFGGPVTQEQLLSVEETSALQEQSRKHKREPMWRVEVPFSERLGPRFKSLLSELRDRNPRPVHVWIERAHTCGVPRAVPLADLNFGFEFHRLPSGIVTIATADLEDDMILDFSRDEQDKETLEIEVSGPRWGNARY